MGKYYEMHRHANEPGTARATVVTEEGGRPLPVRTPEGMPFPHSPDGHEWGYGGSGPTQLAHDILYDALGEEPDRGLYMEFRDAFISSVKSHTWEITEAAVLGWVARKAAVDG